MKRAAIVILVALAGCDKEASQDAAPTPTRQTAAPLPATPNAVPATPNAGPAASPASATPYAGRTGELSNPENVAMVMLYHDLAGIPAPISRLVEGDTRLQIAPGPKKAALREQITAELEAVRDAVKNVGLLRITLADAGLSDYDPGYGEYTIRAISPSSTIQYAAYDTNVTLKFDNARTAQLWRAPAEEAQRISDTLGPYGRAELDLTLAVTGVVPGRAGGTITTRIVEYELRARRGGQTLTRAKPDQ